MKKNIEVPVWEKVTITKEEAAAYSNIGMNKLDELMRNPMCSFVIYIGKKRLIKRKQFEQSSWERIEKAKNLALVLARERMGFILADLLIKMENVSRNISGNCRNAGNGLQMPPIRISILTYKLSAAYH